MRQRHPAGNTHTAGVLENPNLRACIRMGKGIWAVRGEGETTPHIWGNTYRGIGKMAEQTERPTSANTDTCPAISWRLSAP